MHYNQQVLKNRSIKTLAFAAFIFFSNTTSVTAQTQQNVISRAELQKLFQSPPESAKPWVFWYWYYASVTKAGITADLTAMKEAGIAGAYLMPIKGAAKPPYMQPPVLQLTPEWWHMVQFSMSEAKRLGLKIAMHVSDGFALAGGPWIKPEQSMQKVVWTKKQLEGGKIFNDTLQTPVTNEGYYKDIAVFAYPSPIGAGISTQTIKPAVTTSIANVDASVLTDPANTKNVSSADSCWIQYTFETPFTCRSIIINSVTNYQSNRLLVQVSDDGQNFKNVTRLEPSRHGWQDWDAPYTHVIPATTAKYFRFIYSKAGSEPGAEDLDAAKWKPVLKIRGIELSSEPRIHQFEGKNGEVWRVSKRTTEEQISKDNCIAIKDIVDITKFLDKNGRLNWQIPAGNWTILRIGHTSTGHRNDTGGGGKGLECDKFDPAAVKLQFDSWFGEVFKQVDPQVTSSVLKALHVDSWECGSQNWSPVFRDEFKKRRGYDLYAYLPIMAGIPVESADVSEKFLHDVRETIAELIHDNFYVTLANLAHAKGCTLTAETVAPTMQSDGLLHYSAVDVPMGEFWLRSPTHDKPNDMLDAVSGAHIYGKNIVQAESYTELRTMWDEHPGMLKTLQDYNYSLGVNKLVYHVFMHNPWADSTPGMTLDGIGLYFQREQTWWKPGKSWVDYAKRCQALLQIGRPVADVAVFTGEEIPSRAILPDRLVPVLPGIVGKETVEQEAKRLANVGEPLRNLPIGVVHSANMADPENWIDPLRGYAYDSYNKDALVRLSSVKEGNIQLLGGADYKLLVLPGATKMSPNSQVMSVEVAAQLKKLVEGGSTILINGDKPHLSISASNGLENDAKILKTASWLWEGKKEQNSEGVTISKLGKGRIVTGPFTASSFSSLGFERDFVSTDNGGSMASDIAWTHRTTTGLDIYFISNQQDKARVLDISLRTHGRQPELWNPVTGEIVRARKWNFIKGRTMLPVKLEPNESVFIVLKEPTAKEGENSGNNWTETTTKASLIGDWTVTFDPNRGGPAKPVVFNTLSDWSTNNDSSIRYYSGSATYTKTFDWSPDKKSSRVWLNVGKVSNMAAVKINGIDFGVIWTAPYKIDITKAIKPGKNRVEIEVTNTWANRITGDQVLPEEKRITKTNAPYRLEGKPILSAGLLGPVTLDTSK